MIIPPVISRLLIDVALIRDVHRARGCGERSGDDRADRLAKVSNMKKILAVAPPKTNLGGGVAASTSLGNNPPEDRSAPASAGDISARRPIRTRLYEQYVGRATAP